MSNFKNFGVPHYAHPATKPIRPRPPRALAIERMEDKARQMRIHQAIWAWVRANFKPGDLIYMDETSPNHHNFRMANRFCRFREIKQDAVRVDWQDDGHKLPISPNRLYRSGRKIDETTGDEIETPSISVDEE